MGSGRHKALLPTSPPPHGPREEGLSREANSLLWRNSEPSLQKISGMHFCRLGCGRARGAPASRGTGANGPKALCWKPGRREKPPNPRSGHKGLLETLPCLKDLSLPQPACWEPRPWGKSGWLLSHLAAPRSPPGLAPHPGQCLLPCGEVLEGRQDRLGGFAHLRSPLAPHRAPKRGQTRCQIQP